MKNWKYLVAMVVVSLGAYAPDTFAQPTAIAACQSITDPGSYKLTNNLAASGDCLVIQADNVTIDLDGFTITGDTTGTGITDAGSARKRITVRNGMIRTFVKGIDFQKSSQILIERMQLSDNSDWGVAAGFFGSGDGEVAIVKENLFLSNGKGLAVGGRSVVTGNTAFKNSLNGISVGAGSTVIGNTADGNGTVGLEVSEFCTVVNNTAQGNGIPGSSGLRIFCPSNLIGNTALNNGTNLTLIGGGCNLVNNLAP